MSFIDAPPVVVQLRDQLLLCPSVIAAGITIDHIHYPKASPVGEDADPMPFIVIAELSQKRTPYATFAAPLISGQLGSTGYFTDAEGSYAPTIGKIETWARAVALEMGKQYYGLYLRDSEVQLASDLSPGQRATSSDEDNPETAQAGYRTIQTLYNYGLSR